MTSKNILPVWYGGSIGNNCNVSFGRRTPKPYGFYNSFNQIIMITPEAKKYASYFTKLERNPKTGKLFAEIEFENNVIEMEPKAVNF